MANMMNHHQLKQRLKKNGFKISKKTNHSVIYVHEASGIEVGFRFHKHSGDLKKYEIDQVLKAIEEVKKRGY